jgi:hypothetical protein
MESTAIEITRQSRMGYDTTEGGRVSVVRRYYDKWSGWQSECFISRWYPEAKIAGAVARAQAKYPGVPVRDLTPGRER